MSIPMSPEYLLYYVPLVVCVSLALSATKHERPDLIVRQSISTVIWFTVFMLAVAVVLAFAAWWI